MLFLETYEYQQLVLLTRSKKEFGTYLGITQKQVSVIWKQHSLLSPTDWWRSLTLDTQYEMLAEEGSYKKLATRVGCSTATLRTSLITRPGVTFGYTEEDMISDLKKYKSVKLTARCTGYRESDIRAFAKERDINLMKYLDYSFGDNANAKGRRAELDFKEMRGLHILIDCNEVDGSQADTDFVDGEFGRVNVKSSKMYKYKAKTRRDSPYYWKYSTSGLEKSDYAIVLCYDEKMETLLGTRIVAVTPEVVAKKTQTLLKEELEPAKNGIQISAEPG